MNKTNFLKPSSDDLVVLFVESDFFSSSSFVSQPRRRRPADFSLDSSLTEAFFVLVSSAGFSSSSVFSSFS
jgi:hypothetical protein